MVWARFSGDRDGGGGAVLGFVRRAVAAAMGCFFGCFRIKESHSHLISTPDVPRNRNALSSLFLSDEKDDLLRRGGEGCSPLPEEVNVRELKDEAKFLKACGTLLETPVEIRQASGKWADTLAKKEEEKAGNFNSWLPNVSIEKLKEEKPDESPTPVKNCEEDVATGASSLMETPKSCMTHGHNTRRASISSTESSDIQNVITPMDVPDNETHSSEISSVSTGVLAMSVHHKNKSVRFDCDSDRSTFSPESSSQHSKQSGLAGNYSVSKASPYPTPLKLTDEMQTPGTVFPAYLNDMAGGKTTRIRSQYVYSVLNQAEYPSQWKELKDENFDSNHRGESCELNHEAGLTSTPVTGMSMKYLSVGKDKKDDLSSSSSLKSQSTDNDGNSEQLGSTSGETVHCGKTPGDRPILGMVAAHWNAEEASRISPKWWDGNGVPNSTNKYKEDQKVSWHATPFEERLEKALSEEFFIPQRKPVVGTPPVEFNEADESDTASSQLQSPAHPKPVVSF